MTNELKFISLEELAAKYAEKNKGLSFQEYTRMLDQAVQFSSLHPYNGFVGTFPVIVTEDIDHEVVNNKMIENGE